jgi:phenylpropionate dioxygenase-like ring-hydroxylating dioxygenase large terminal subunit
VTSSTPLSLMRRLLAKIADDSIEQISRTTQLSVDRYLDPDLAERERVRVFRRHPVVVAHGSDVGEVGDFVRAELAGTPLVLVRTKDGVRAFVNACRHRGARLVDDARGCGKKAFTCPYHAWSYGLDGGLIHVPHEGVFAGLDRDEIALVPVACELRHGFVWAQLEGDLDVASYLGPQIDEDLSAFDLASHTATQTRVHPTPANWKLVMDAFAEGYHLASLHRKSLARFFLEPSILDDFSPHLRQVGARKTILDARQAPEEEWDFRDQTTLFYNLFPNTALVFHPLFITQLTFFPQGVAGVEVVHRMLVPPGERSQVASERITRSYEHIDGEVFQREDLRIAESIQSTLASGANTHVLLGGKEEGMRLFHAAWEQAMGGL